MKRCTALLLAAFCVGLSQQNAWGKSGEASFTLEVLAGRWKAGRVKNIPAGAKLGVEVRADGPIEILLLGAEDYARFPSPERPVFRGKTEDTLSVSLLAPKSGDYYVLIDNRTGSEPRSVEITIRGETPDGDAEAKLRDFEERMAQLFVFEPFRIRVRTCGKPQAFVDSSGIVLCKEYMSKLHEHLQDRKKMENVLIFTLLHEVGHVLLKQWGYPTYASEETADEFATVLIVMLDQKERLRAQAEFFYANASIFELISKALRNDRHPLSGQRARNILRWSEEPDLVFRWQPIFVPHMQTLVLERLRQAPTRWADPALVEQELAARR